MRKRQTFLLTILSQEDESSCFCGRIKVISSGRTSTFTSLDELYSLISNEMGEEVLQHLAKQVSQKNGSDEKVLSS